MEHSVEEYPGAGDATPGRGHGRWSRLRPWQQGLLVLGVGVGAFALLVGLRGSPEVLEPPRQIPTVSTAPARAGSGAIRVRGYGTVRPSAEISVAPQVGGRVSRVSPAFVSGGRFRAGDVLFRIDPADYENAVEAASADVAQRQVGVLQAEEEVEIARDEYERLARREGLDPEAASPLVLREPQLQAARAALRSAEARLEDARLALDRTNVRAPFDGIVRDESVDIGQFVVPGQSVGRIYSTDAVEVVIPLSDDEAARIAALWSTRAGDPATRIPASIEAEYGGTTYRWEAFVDRAESALDERTRTVDVVLHVPEPFTPSEAQPDRPPLLIGTYATADIEGASYERYLVVPSAAVRDDDVVWVVESDTLLAMRPIELIQEVEDRAYVLGDLDDGEPVIVSGLPFVTDGMTVRRIEPLETAAPPGGGPEVSAVPDGEAGGSR
ncbi:MAG: efflux RND transporter periplasmic adaptor subunit [Gemmatimonadota bacterium]|nr:efflux RND transporter periplasmic adaptor subunit [Gemmatimonadota bacterium]